MRTSKVLVSLFVVSLICASTAFGLTIRVAPGVLVLHSADGSFSIHTDVKGANHDVNLTVDGVPVVRVWTKTDSLGNLVVKCSQDAVKAVISEFDGKTTTVTVHLAVKDYGEASMPLEVRK